MDRALSANAAYAALTLALALPSICAQLEQENPSTKGKDKDLYVKWYNRWVSRHLPQLTGEDCYSLRCGVLHFGSAQHSSMQSFDQIEFTVDNNVSGHGNSFIGKASSLQLDLKLYCNVMRNSVLDWAKSPDDASVKHKNVLQMLCYRLRGMLGLKVVILASNYRSDFRGRK